MMSLLSSRSRRVSAATFVVVLGAVLVLVKEQRGLSSIATKSPSPRPSKQNVMHSGRKPGEPPYRMLLGIFSMEAQQELSRRKLIKNTYLSFSNALRKFNVTTVPPHTQFCSLQRFMQGNISRSEDCQFLYTFVVGGHSRSELDQPTEYLNIYDDRPITVDPSTIPTPREDTTYLNIRENMNDGKSQTWFKYASSQIPDDLHIDLIAKVDSDCVVFPTRLIQEVERVRLEQNIEYPLRRIYGGSHQLGGDVSYMQGGFYFMSRDIAQYITSDQCDRETIIEEYEPHYKNQRAEDVEMSRFVYSHPGGVQEIEIPRRTAYEHEEKLKRMDAFRDKWKWYIAAEVAADRIAQIQSFHNNKCPSKEAFSEERLTIDEGFQRLRSRFDLLTTQLLKKCGNESLTSTGD